MHRERLTRHDEFIAGEEAKAIVRTLHLSELQVAGEARLRALVVAREQLDLIAQLLPAALEAGISLTEISRRTCVSRQTLYEMLKGR